MNRLSNYFLLLFMSATVIFVTSCGDDTENPIPSNTAVTFADTASIVTASPGDTVSLQVNGIGVENIQVTSNGTPTLLFVDGDNEVAPGESVSIVIPVTAQAGTNYEITASATDANVNAQKTITIVFGNVVEVLTSDTRFSILAGAVQQAGLLNSIQDGTTQTIFAPTDAAFEAIGVTSENISEIPNLSDILLYHVVGQRILSSEVPEDGTEVETGSENSLYAIRDGDAVRVNGVQVSDADFVAANGVVHVVDKVLFPTFWEATMLAAPTTDQASETFFSTRLGETYSVNDVTNSDELLSPFIDFGYGWGPDNQATLEAVDSYTRYGLENEGWNALNDVDFRMTNLTPADFDSANPADVASISGQFDTGEEQGQEGTVNMLEADDIVAFRTEDGRFGLIKVVEIEPGVESNDFIRIEVKVTN